MKKLICSVLLVSTVFFMGCEGPAGPQGIPGPEGAPGPLGPEGVNVVSTVFDVDGSFNAANEYQIFFDFPPEEVEVFETDAVLVYRKWEEIKEGNETLSVWRLLPQTQFMPQGLMQYNYDHTFLDVSIFIDAQFDRATLAPKWTQNQTFRVVIVPAEFARNLRVAGVDFANYEEVRDFYAVNEGAIKKYKAKK